MAYCRLNICHPIIFPRRIFLGQVLLIFKGALSPRPCHSSEPRIPMDSPKFITPKMVAFGVTILFLFMAVEVVLIIGQMMGQP
jgi:hypothetical protein